jgi:hypothetical protein
MHYGQTDSLHPLRCRHTRNLSEQVSMASQFIPIRRLILTHDACLSERYQLQCATQAGHSSTDITSVCGMTPCSWDVHIHVQDKPNASTFRVGTPLYYLIDHFVKNIDELFLIPWRWRQKAASKHSCLYINLQGVIGQENRKPISIRVRTARLAVLSYNKRPFIIFQAYFHIALTTKGSGFNWDSPSRAKRTYLHINLLKPSGNFTYHQV